MRTTWLAAAKFIGMALNFMLPLILVRKLSQSEYGLYKQAFQVLATAISLLTLQVSGSVYIFMPREPEKKAQVAMNVTIFYLIVGGMVALWFALHPGWVTAIFKSDGLVPLMPIIGLTIMLWLIASTFEGVMIADGDIRRASVVIACMQVSKTAMLTGAAVWQGSIRSLVFAAAAFGAIQCAIFAVYLHRRFGPFWWPIDWALFKAQVANSLPYGMGNLVLMVQYDLHNYMVSYHFDPALFAIYSVGSFQLPLLLILLDSVDTILIPEIARLEKEGRYGDILRTWMGGVRILAFCFVPICVLLFVMRREFITGLFTQNYLASVPVFAISLVNLLLLTSLTGPVLRAFADFRYFRLKLFAILLPLTGVALLAGIRVAGLVGAMTAVVLVRVLDVTITSAAIGRKLGISRKDAHYLTPFLRIAAASAIAAAAVAMLRPILPNLRALAMFLVCAVIFGLVYLVAAYLAGAVTETEKAALYRSFGKFIKPGAARIELSAAPEA